ncbi:MAG: fumarylacetoacetate hydrolase family protein [Bacteroidales bacterium]|jgi:2-keto-4-pentenoate hydratase/2-oxohepta-3-ene-1,7-dioic acid hydratase in catechol pathway|nr:fumarylacetoacetate hydrolase family protein [Bacteroidales bacterium]
MKIICVENNYREHIQGLKHYFPNFPSFFFKPDTALTTDNYFYLPDFAQRFECKCELVIKIDKVGKCIDRKFAHKYYSQVALGMNFTAENEGTDQNLSSAVLKAFDYSALISHNFVPIADVEREIQNIDFYIMKNGVRIWNANTSLMIFPVNDLISHISQYITLKTGDLIFTGSPCDAMPIEKGDFFEGFLQNEQMLHCLIK